jgi:hypothetical protein
MKRQILSFMLGVFCITNISAMNFSCESKGNHEAGPAQLKGTMDQLNAKVTVSGEAFYSSISKKEKITFFRNQRENEEQYSYARYTGGGLFHLFYFSVPKKFLAGEQENFTAYLRYLREGVGGIGEITLKCASVEENTLMNTIISRYRNLITYDRVQDQGDDDKMIPVTFEMLPRRVVTTLKKLKINISYDWDFDETFTDSPYVVNFSLKPQQNDALEVRDPQGTTVGYVFNVTTCNSEECYGWDALYLNQDGHILYQSF